MVTMESNLELNALKELNWSFTMFTVSLNDHVILISISSLQNCPAIFKVGSLENFRSKLGGVKLGGLAW